MVGLVRMWDTMLLKIRLKAVRNKDNKTLVILREIEKTPYSIKHEILKFYL